MSGQSGMIVRGRAGLSLVAFVGCGIIVTGCQGSQPSEIGLGTLGGAAAGGAIGSTIGGGRGNTLAIVGGALVGGALGNQMVDKPIQQQQQAQAEASRDRTMQRQLDYERQSAMQQEQVRREIQEQQLFEEWKRERLNQPTTSSS
jgi:outer membrane lipoprotein SlyB